MKRVILTVVLITAAYARFPAGPRRRRRFDQGIGLPYAVLAAVALYKMWDDGTLLDYLVPKWGDLSIGLTAALLLLCSFAARSVCPRDDGAAGLALPHLHPARRSGRDPALALHVLAGYRHASRKRSSGAEWCSRSSPRDSAIAAVGSRRRSSTARARSPPCPRCAVPEAGLNPLRSRPRWPRLGVDVHGRAHGAHRARVFSHAFFTYLSAVQFRLPGFYRRRSVPRPPDLVLFFGRPRAGGSYTS